MIHSQLVLEAFEFCQVFVRGDITFEFQYDDQRYNHNDKPDQNAQIPSILPRSLCDADILPQNKLGIHRLLSPQIAINSVEVKVLIDALV